MAARSPGGRRCTRYHLRRRSASIMAVPAILRFQMDLAGEELFELRQLFLRELAEGHVVARQALEKLDADALQALRGVFHKIAGTAEAVNLGLLGRLAAVCEATLDALIDGSARLSKRHERILREGVEGMGSPPGGAWGAAARCGRASPSRPRRRPRPIFRPPARRRASWW